MKRLWLAIAVTGLLGVASNVMADTVEMKDGSKLNGKVLKIDAGKVTLKTTFAGDLVIDQKEVALITTDQPVNVVLPNGDKVTGKISSDAEKGTVVDGAYGQLRLDNVPIKTLWAQGTPDPLAPVVPPTAKWAYQLGFDLAGKTGNSEAISLGGFGDATLKDQEMTLKLYTRGGYAKSNGVLSSSYILGGIDFERMLTKSHSWYIRDEMQRDNVKGLDYRNSFAAGYGYYVFNEPATSLRLRAGIGHTYQGYRGGTSDSAVTLDFGLKFKKQISEYATWYTDLTYEPSVQDFNNFRIYHESKLELPLAAKEWKLQLGVSNEYYNQVLPDRERLDTLYFARIVFTW
jgi:putative salt-induced outer membrane protein YdiY